MSVQVLCLPSTAVCGSVLSAKHVCAARECVLSAMPMLCPCPCSFCQADVMSVPVFFLPSMSMPMFFLNGKHRCLCHAHMLRVRARVLLTTTVRACALSAQLDVCSAPAFILSARHICLCQCSFSPDVILCGCLGLKHQPTNQPSSLSSLFSLSCARHASVPAFLPSCASSLVFVCVCVPRIQCLFECSFRRAQAVCFIVPGIQCLYHCSFRRAPAVCF